MRLIHALLTWLSVPDRWARWMVLKAVDRLVRLDYLLFEVVQALPMPPDLDSMREFRSPENSAVRMASMLESVQAEYLRPYPDTGGGSGSNRVWWHLEEALA